MCKKVVKAGLIGAAIGIIGVYLWTVVISFMIEDGSRYYGCVPALVEMMGNETMAVLLQIVVSALVGGGSAAASYIWKNESWSLAKQTILYYLITCTIYFPCAYIVCWMQHSVRGAVIYYAIYTAIFIMIWIIQYLANRSKVQKINEALNHTENREAE